MTSRSIALAALVALAPLSAKAADMPYPGPYPQATYYTWNGYYAGFNVGYGWGRSTWEAIAFTADPAGWQAGFTLGANWQAGNIVYGIEGDIDFSNMSQSGACGAFTCETKNGWLGTARLRIGYAFDRFLPYVTGGLAAGDVKASSPAFAGSHSTQFGWTIGAGIEAAISASWTAKLEYLYVDLGSFDCHAACGTVAPSNIGFTANIVRVGLNYRFSGPIYSRW
jgi:outer membrane immunogenic protein